MKANIDFERRVIEDIIIIPISQKDCVIQGGQFDEGWVIRDSLILVPMISPWRRLKWLWTLWKALTPKGAAQ